MDAEKRSRLSAWLQKELIPALGCTEPIAIALAAAAARETLGQAPETLQLVLSENVIKNAKGVLVPHSGGRVGIEIAAALGALFGSASAGLRVLEAIDGEQQEAAAAYAASGKITVTRAKTEASLYIEARAAAGTHEAAASLVGSHRYFHTITKDGEVIYRGKEIAAEETAHVEDFRLKDFYAYARDLESCPEEELFATLRKQITYNLAIAREGLTGAYGAQVGKTILETEGKEHPAALAKARAAAGSDARMSGCGLPVIINSGSGNQGITVSMPVYTYAQQLGVSEEKMLAALALANLTALYQKRYIGKLSAFCGAASAAAGAGAGIGYLKDFSLSQIEGVVTNTIVGVGGMLCDGAKASCALKIAVAVSNALLSVAMCERGHRFSSGSGLVGEDADQTVRNIGHIAHDGLREADREILAVMTEGGC